MKRKSKGWQLSLIGLSSLSLGCNEKGVYKAGHLIFIVQCKFLECSFLSKLNLHSRIKVGLVFLLPIDKGKVSAR